jgi:hypothetical protein
MTATTVRMGTRWLDSNLWSNSPEHSARGCCRFIARVPREMTKPSLAPGESTCNLAGQQLTLTVIALSSHSSGGLQTVQASCKGSPAVGIPMPWRCLSHSFRLESGFHFTRLAYLRLNHRKCGNSRVKFFRFFALAASDNRRSCLSRTTKAVMVARSWSAVWLSVSIAANHSSG